MIVGLGGEPCGSVYIRNYVIINGCTCLRESNMDSVTTESPPFPYLNQARMPHRGREGRLMRTE